MLPETPVPEVRKSGGILLLAAILAAALAGGYLGAEIAARPLREAIATRPPVLIVDVAAALEGVIAAAAVAAGLAPGKLNQPLRAAVTGTGIGAGIFETIEIIGKARTLARLQAEQWLVQK